MKRAGGVRGLVKLPHAMGISLDQLEERVRQAKVEFIAQKRAEKAAGKTDHWKGRQEGAPPQEGRQTP